MSARKIFVDFQGDNDREIVAILDRNRMQFKKLWTRLATVVKVNGAVHLMSITNMTYGEYLDWLALEYCDLQFDRLKQSFASPYATVRSEITLWKYLHEITNDLVILRYCLFKLVDTTK